VKLDVALCLPQEVETVALIRSVVTDTLVKLGVTTECVDDIRLALSEACTNVIAHAGVRDEYEVRLQVDNERCQIRVINTGGGFDAEALTGEMPDAGSARGRGVAIMRAVMDQVDFISEPEAGTIVHLSKALMVEPGGALDRLRSPA
jgi:serine/threonine-protein kinase RsbW